MTRRRRRRATRAAASRPLFTAASAFAALAMASSPAWALCPMCLGQESTLSPRLRLVGLFLLAPALVFFVVLGAMRRLLARGDARPRVDPGE